VGVQEEGDGKRERMEREDQEMARRAFMTEEGEKVRRIGEGDGEEEAKVGGLLLGNEANDKELMPPPTFKRGVKRKKDFAAALGIKKKPALV
jgi:hypothetical protein